MKKYKSILLCSAVLLSATLAVPQVFANTSDSTTQTTTSTTSTPSSTTTEVPFSDTSESATKIETATESQKTVPAISPGSLASQQDGQKVTLAYNFSQGAATSDVRFAVWSTKDGNADLNWYTATQAASQILLSEHSGYGEYTIETYQVVDGQEKLIDSTKINFAKPAITLVSSISEAGYLDVQVQNLPSTTTSVRIPIWSAENGQDDLVWYTATRNSDGSYSVRAPLKNHKLTTGTYHVHAYVKELQQTSTSITASSQFLVEKAHLPNTTPQLSITNLQAVKGTYQVNITPSVAGKTVQSVQVASWSATDQSNIKWRTATNQNGTYITKVDFQEQKNLTGIYQNHVYITYTDGTKSGYVAETVDLTSAQLPLKVTTDFSGKGNFTTTIDNVYGSGTVSYAVWSDENGQDDLKWYTATQSADRAYTSNFSILQHKGTGKYHLHVYQAGRGLGAFTFQVSTNHRVVEANTYPVGQCTWGAKEVAPWVGNYWGNAAQWLDSAQKAGYKVGTTPRVGALMVWTGGYYGHVAVVTAINGSLIQVVESNYAGHMTVGNYRGWFNPNNEVSIGYVYPN